MSGHDATSIVAGVREPTDPVTPEQVAERFCGPEAAGLVAGPGTIKSEDGTITSRGFCGYSGGRGDELVTGFDNGYSFMGYLLDRGWRAIPSKGDWPYLVYAAWPARQGGTHAIAEYCEGDLTVWRFARLEDASAHFATLLDCR